MTAIVNGNSKRYSWWWDSHISPKNSKWLQENLTDMDSKVKQMIKVIEEDADSFARRAEMYYKKRPELMKLVEEFYRAYRALAERYDHATGVIRHAHRTMAEAFPNQDPMMFGDESHVGSSTDEFDPQTPETYPPIRAPVYPNDLQQDALGSPLSHLSSVKRNIAFIEDPQSTSNGRGFKIGKARKGLNFNDGDGKERNVISNVSHDIKVPSESERASKAEAEIMALKDALSKVQAEKEASLAQFDKNLEKLSNLESEISRAQEDCRELKERATRAETEAQTLREHLNELETEKESSLLQYQQCLQNIADLEDRISLAQKDAGEVNERANKAEAETLTLKQSLVRSETDKEAALVQYRQCLETISNMEERLRKAEEDARLINERAEKAEVEVESLKQSVSELVEEKKASELQYQQCLDTIADLKLKLFHAQEETQRLSREIDDGVAKLKFAEEKCLVLERSNENLHFELDGLLEKLGNQSQELTEKQKEMGRLWTCVQEEHLRFMEAETAFQTLQQLHSQSQEELNALALELQRRSQILKDMEVRNNDLLEEVQEAKDENKSLNELNLSSAASIQSLQEEVSSLRDKIQKLEAEVELRVDQRNALQQEIYCLKEELSQIGKKHQSMVEQVELVGLHPECIGSSVKELQEENSELKELKEREESEKMILLEKLVMMEKLVQKNFLLENSISDLNSELETIKGKLKTLEEACQSLVEEKSGLLTEKDLLLLRLQSATDNSEKLSEENRLLDNSLVKANAELEELKSKLNSLEDSCRLLNDDKSSLTNERENLRSRIDLMRRSLEDLEKEQAELKMKVSELGTEREYSLKEIEELGVSLDAKDREYATFVQFSESRMNEMESKICHLEGESQLREKEYQVELDRAHDAHIEIIVLQKCLQDLLENRSSLFSENQNIKEASKLLKKLVSELEQENIEKQVQIDSSINCIKLVRAGIHQVLMKLEIIPDIISSDENSQDQKIIHDILNRLDEMQTGLLEVWHENQYSVIENLVLVEFLGQLKSEAVGIAAEKKMLEDELESQHKQLSSSQDETQKLVFMSGELTTKINQALNKEELLKVEIEDLHRQVMQFRDNYSILQEQNYKTLDEKRHLSLSTTQLEEDIFMLLSETMYQSNLIILLENALMEKLSGAIILKEDLDRLSSSKCQLEKEVKEIGHRLTGAEIEKSQLEGLLEKSDTELLSAKSANDQLELEIANVKEHLGHKEKELLEAMLMISIVQTEKSELSKAVEDFECRYKEAKAIEEEKDMQALKLRGDHDELIKKNSHANETNQKLEAHVENLLMELEEIKADKENLNQELFKEKNEVETWESQATTLFGDLQISAVQETLLQGLTHELAEACKSFEKRSTLKDVEIDQLHGKVNNLEDANKGQNDRMSKYIQAIVLLKGSIKSLEDHLDMPRKFGNEPVNGTDSATDHDNSSSFETDSTKEEGLVELQELHFRIKAIEEALTEKEKLAMEELNSATNRRIKRKEQRRRSGSLRIPNHEIYTEGSEMITKDIVLDHVSDSTTETLKIEDKDHSFEPQKSQRGKSLSEESLIVDKLEISDRFTDPNKEVNKRKVLERLNSDLQKLSNLQITVEDLKTKVGTDEKQQAKGKDDYETIKGQINEAEEAIKKLLNINKKLVSKVESGFVRSDGSLSSIDFEETESSRRRRISEQARRGSEKIGRLQLEIQRLQFLLMKLEGKREENAKVKVLESKRTLLRDYIYGGVRGERRKKMKKRFAFCGCVQPPVSP